MDPKRRTRHLNKFRTLAAERLERISRGLTALESSPKDKVTSEEIMREAHTLKGEARLVGHGHANRLAHKTEELLIRAQSMAFARDSAVLALVWDGLDALRGIVQAEPNADERKAEVDDFCRRADEALGAAPDGSDSDSDRPVAAKTTKERPAEREAGPRDDVRFTGLARIQTVRVDRANIERISELVGELVGTQAATEELNNQSHNSIESLIRQLGSARADLRRLEAQQDTGAGASSILRSLTELFSEQERLCKNLRSMFAATREKDFDNRARLEELDGRIQEARLLPASTLFEPFPAAARRLAREYGKRVRVQVQGAEAEADQHVLEVIGEPILHLIRNAVDHGIESPAERQAAGKPETGTLTLGASQRGSQVEIVVADDGRGVDLEGIRRTAVERGLVDPAAAEELDAQQLLDIAFRSGFSTRPQTTDVSGRGVGLDVVKQRIEDLGGTVEVRFSAGAGTTFVLTVPTSILVTHALIVECSDQSLAIPSDAVDVAIEAGTEQIVPAGAGFAVRLDDEAIPLVDLGAALRLRDPVGLDTLNGSRVLIIKHQERRIALLIDRLIGQQQLTHRALDPFIERSPYFIGTVSLKRGQIALLVNPAAMFRSSDDASIGVHVERHEQSETQRACVMVVDDSEMSRDLFVGVVRDLGFDVLEAVNGKNALERMVERRPDLVLTDLEMPLLDGFGLIEQVRSSPDLKSIPIIVCSTRGSVDDKKRAVQLGADAYLVKSDFSEQRLETTLMRFLSEPVHGT